MCKRLIAVVLALVSTGLCQAQASPFEQHGMGARSTALAGAMTAVSSDLSGVYYNPAALTGQSSVDFGIGFDMRAPQLSVDAKSPPTEASLPANDASSNYGVHLAARFPLLAKYDYPLVLGLAASLPLSQSTRIEASTPTTQQFYRYDAHADSYTLIAALAARVHDWVSLGVGAHFLGGIDGYYDLELDFIRRRFQREVAYANFNYTLSFSAGLFVQPNSTWSFGVSFQDSIELGYSLDNQTRLAGLADFDVQGYGIALYTPQQFRLGARWSALPKLHIHVDLLWQRWSQAPDPSAKAVVKVSSTVLDLDDTAFSDRVIDLGAEDTLSPRVGVEWEYGRWTLRGGYAFVPTPLPAQTGVDNYIDARGHLMSLGTEIGFLGAAQSTNHPLSVAVAAQSLLLPARTMRKANPMDPVGDYEAGGAVWFANLTIIHRF